MIAAFDGVEIGSEALRLLRVQFLEALLHRGHEHWTPEESHVSHRCTGQLVCGGIGDRHALGILEAEKTEQKKKEV